MMRANDQDLQVTVDPPPSCVSRAVWAVYEGAREARAAPKGAGSPQLCLADLSLDLERVQHFGAASEEGGLEALVSVCADQCLRMCQQDSTVLDSSTRTVFQCSDSPPQPPPPLQQEAAFCLALHCTAAVEALLGRCLGPDRQGALILKDVLADARLLDRFPPLFVSLCRYLFLPAHLNFRNLIWHGFMSPSEVDIRYVALCLALERTVRRAAGGGPTRPRDFSAFAARYRPFLSVGESFDTADTAELVRGSLVALPAQRGLLLSAFDAYKRGMLVQALLQALPCVEHGLRLAFCLCNALPEYLLAWPDAYFSTLDGFGQRSKHQLLLDFDLLSYEHKSSASAGGGPAQPPRPNLLLHALGGPLYAALVDLFFTDGGPNVRSAFAHGEYDTSQSPLCEGAQTGGIAGLPEVAAAVMCAAVRLLSLFRVGGPAASALRDHCHGLDRRAGAEAAPAQRERLAEAQTAVRLLLAGASAAPPAGAPYINATERLCTDQLSGYRSYFHMNSILADELRALVGELSAAAPLLRRRDGLRTGEERCSTPAHRAGGACSPGCAAEVLVAVPVPVPVPAEGPSGVATVLLWESAARLAQCLPSAEGGTVGDTATAVCAECLSLMNRLNDIWRDDQCTAIHAAFAPLATACLEGPDASGAPPHECAGGWADGLLDVIGASAVAFRQRVFVAMFPACLQLARDLRRMCASIRRAVADKEQLLLQERAHSSDRRQYLGYVTCLSPVVLSLACFSTQLLVCHVFACGELRAGGRAVRPACVRAVCTLVPVVSGCLPAPGPLPQSETTTAASARTQNDKKPMDRVLKQALSVLRSRGVQLLGAAGDAAAPR